MIEIEIEIENRVACIMNKALNRQEGCRETWKDNEKGPYHSAK